MAVRELEVPKSCILFATADWDEPYWTNKQHCAKSLAELGVTVLYVESVGIRSPKAGSVRDWKRLVNRLRKGLSSLIFGATERSPRILVLSPLLIPAGHRYGWARLLNRWLLKVLITRSARMSDFDNSIIWTYHPFMLDVIGEINSRCLLYHCVDDIAALPGVNKKEYREAESRLLKRADTVFVTAKSLLKYCLTINSKTYFYPNVVDDNHFGTALLPRPLPHDLIAIPEPRIVYHGVLSDFKIDFQLLLECARLRPEWSWVFIGEEREGQNSKSFSELSKLPNVYVLGYRPYEMLPDYLRGMQLGLLPSQLNDYTEGMFPMKYFEFIAAGLPVVSTPLAFTDTYRAGIIVADNADKFVVAIDSQLERGRLSIDEIKSIVGENTWITRTSKMLSVATGQ